MERIANNFSPCHPHFCFVATTCYLTEKDNSLLHATVFRMVLSSLMWPVGYVDEDAGNCSHGVSKCHCDMQRQACDSSSINFPFPPLLLLLPLYITACYIPKSYPYPPLLSALLHLFLLFPLQSPPAVCPTLWAFTQLWHKETRALTGGCVMCVGMFVR